MEGRGLSPQAFPRSSEDLTQSCECKCLLESESPKFTSTAGPSHQAPDPDVLLVRHVYSLCAPVLTSTFSVTSAPTSGFPTAALQPSASSVGPSMGSAPPAPALSPAPVPLPGPATSGTLLGCCLPPAPVPLPFPPQTPPQPVDSFQSSELITSLLDTGRGSTSLGINTSLPGSQTHQPGLPPSLTSSPTWCHPSVFLGEMSV